MDWLWLCRSLGHYMKDSNLCPVILVELAG
jgi:hypothetical protein